MNHPRLSLVIPCYNEEQSLPLLIERCREVFADRDDIEVVLVDNGSTDDSPTVLSEHLADEDFIRSVRVDVNQGYGHGILSGLRAARGEILAWTHADMQTDPSDALEGLAVFDEADDAELLYVKGSRYGRPVTDVVFTVGMACFESALLGTWMWDINAQPNMFHRSFFDAWVDPPTDFSLDLFVYYLARTRGFRLVRFPVHFGPRAFGDSRWNIDWTSRFKFIRRTVDYSVKMKKEHINR